MLVFGESYREDLRDHRADSFGRSIGTYNWDSVVELEHPEAFQNALVKVLDVKKTFRYVYLGGAFTETDQEKPLWWLAEGRRVRVRLHLISHRNLYYPFYFMLTHPRDLPRQNYLTLERGMRM